MTVSSAVPEEHFEKPWLRWLIAVSVSLAALLCIIDMSIVNVALPEIQGNLGCTLSEVGWVVTAYSIANAIVIPLTAWLDSLLGKKNYFLLSMVVFTLASVTCGCSANLSALIISRIVQGAFGGSLLVKAQAILFETFPLEEQGAAQGLFGLVAMIGPTIGPTLGGYLTDTLNWRWIFYINVPFGILAVLLIYFLLPNSSVRKPSSIDFVGVLLLVSSLGSIQTVLEEGQREDWFNCNWIAALTVVGVVSLVLFIWYELRVKCPAVDLRVLRHRSLAAGVAYSHIFGITLFGAMFAVPVFAQSILHYTSMQTGLLMLPGAIASVVVMPLAARLSGKVDARLLIGAGTALCLIAMLQLAGLNRDTSAESMFLPLVLRGAGAVFMFLPLSIASMGALPKEDIAAGAGLFNVSRQLGGSIGVAGLTTILDQRQHFHRAILVEHVNPYNPVTAEYLRALGGLAGRLSDPVGQAHTAAAAMINGMVNLQAYIMSYADCFFVAAVLFVVSLPLLIFLDKGTSGSAPLPGAE